MINRIIFALIITFSLSACTTLTKKTPEVKSVKGIETYLGNYVDGAYQKRSEGYDWVSVSVVQCTDTSVHVAVRSRADKKKPTCTFDADAVLAKPDTLKAMVEGKAILFAFSGNSLTIFAQNKEDEGLLNYFCTGGGSLAARYYKIAEPIDTTQVDRTIFRKTLSWNTYSFEVSLTGKKLTIQPFGLTKDNHKVEHEIEGTVVNAEIGDLNLDTFPEVLVYITSNGSGSYGSVIGYSVNNGKSMSMINLPNIADNPKANVGYMGHDEFAIVESSFCQRFPIYKPGDINAKPTGGMRQIQYKLKDGESMRQFVIDKILDY